MSECLVEHRRRMLRRCRRRLGVTIKKQMRRLVLTCDGVPVKGYFVALGFAPSGPKRQRDDGRTPEGDYYLWGRNPRSRYYLSLGISYPNPADAECGLAAGLIDRATYEQICRAYRARRKPPQDTRLGGDIYLHGGGVADLTRAGALRYVQVRDWTWGCVAMRNQDIRELFDALPTGTRVRILP